MRAEEKIKEKKKMLNSSVSSKLSRDCERRVFHDRKKTKVFFEWKKTVLTDIHKPVGRQCNETVGIFSNFRAGLLDYIWKFYPSGTTILLQKFIHLLHEVHI